MDTIKVEVAYARPESQRIIALTVPLGTTVGQAIELSGICLFFPEINLEQQNTGIFSRPVALSEVLKESDRVEIYRPLQCDPKEARRQRARLARQRK